MDILILILVPATTDTGKPPAVTEYYYKSNFFTTFLYKTNCLKCSFLVTFQYFSTKTNEILDTGSVGSED